MAGTYTVETIAADGSRSVEEYPMTPAMEEANRRLREAASRVKWCSCEEPDWDTGERCFRGHSVDVACGRCGGWLQIG